MSGMESLMPLIMRCVIALTFLVIMLSVVQSACVVLQCVCSPSSSGVAKMVCRFFANTWRSCCQRQASGANSTAVAELLVTRRLQRIGAVLRFVLPFLVLFALWHIIVDDLTPLLWRQVDAGFAKDFMFTHSTPVRFIWFCIALSFVRFQSLLTDRKLSVAYGVLMFTLLEKNEMGDEG